MADRERDAEAVDAPDRMQDLARSESQISPSISIERQRYGCPFR